MSQILLAIFGVLLGAWINNVFTWKIKNKIEYIDHFVKHLLQLNVKYENKESNNSNNDIGITEAEAIFANQLLNGEFTAKLQEYRRVIRCYSSNDFTPKEKNDFSLTARSLLEDLIKDVLTEREKITSFCYMLKELNPLKIRCAK